MSRIRAAGAELSYQIRKPRCYIGYIAFVLFALLNKVRPIGWEGKQVVFLLFWFVHPFNPNVPLVEKSETKRE